MWRDSYYYSSLSCHAARNVSLGNKKGNAHGWRGGPTDERRDPDASNPLGRKYPWGGLATRGFYVVIAASLLAAGGREESTIAWIFHPSR